MSQTLSSPVSFAPHLIGAIDWRLDGYLSGTMSRADASREVMLWSIRLKRGAVLGCYCQPIGPRMSFSERWLCARGGYPWLSLELALSLSARGAIAWPGDAVLCKRARGLYLALGSEHNPEVTLHRFTAGQQVSWRIPRPTPGRLVQLHEFEDHVGLLDVPEGHTQSARLILCALGPGTPRTQYVQLGARCQRPGIVNAYVAPRHCVLDLILSDPCERGAPGRLWRCRVERRSGAWSKQLLSPCHVIDAAVQLDHRGRAQRFAYLSGVDTHTALSGLCSLDLTGSSTRWSSIPFAQTARGLAIVGATHGSAEDAGWLATILHDHANDRSGILLGLLRGLAVQPRASIRMPADVRLGDVLMWSTHPAIGCGEMVDG